MQSVNSLTDHCKWYAIGVSFSNGVAFLTGTSRLKGRFVSKVIITPLLDYPDHVDTVVALIMETWPQDSTRNPLIVKQRLCGEQLPGQLPFTLLALQKDTLIGFSTVIRLVMEPNQEFWIDNLYVHENARGEGLGSRLLQAAAEKSQEFGIRDLYAYTSNVNLYLHNGWKTILKDTAEGETVVMLRRLKRI